MFTLFAIYFDVSLFFFIFVSEKKDDELFYIIFYKESGK